MSLMYEAAGRGASYLFLPVRWGVSRSVRWWRRVQLYRRARRYARAREQVLVAEFLDAIRAP